MDFLTEALEGIEVEDNEVINRVLETLKAEPFNCKYPLLAVQMIKIKILAKREIEIKREDITRWGNRVRG